ncbi:hypothetical protein GCM10010193_11760 [Kitasatospora atroaurantiaca]|uniref:Uncharacterized protein n=1 Tax=Kitasatospora atroaurantiaca TaxID=285545 RepID=A0A561EQH2_9ACTN|nr:hypothetical protein [Kitasatospora atroaurantiaca]TWE17868.1 hypothetical protein FB465_2906 [Kitasatospora atroaurantiaca]
MKNRYAPVAAPLLLAVYGGIRLLPGSKDPGAGWLVGHAALFAALLLFGVVTADLRRLVTRRAVGAVAAGVAFTGLAASLGQVTIDLYVGVRAADKAEKALLFDRIQDHPGVLPIFYSVGPLLFYVGMLALLTATVRRLSVLSPLLVLAGTVAMAADLDLLAVGAALYLAALWPLVRGSVRPVAAAA